MLQVDKLHQYYGGSHILRGLTFDVKVGEVTCLLGRNGVGKTTLLKCLMGLLPAKDGAVSWEGKPITTFKPHQRVHAGGGEQNRRVIFGNQRGAGNDGVALLLKELQKQAAQIVGAFDVDVHFVPSSTSKK